MSSRMRETRGHTGNRRSHHKIAAPRLSLCSDCNEYHERHRACLACGKYRGRDVVKMKVPKQEEAVVITVAEEESQK